MAQRRYPQHALPQPTPADWRSGRLQRPAPVRDESMGPPRKVPRHQSVSRLADAWRSSEASLAPIGHYGVMGPSTPAHSQLSDPYARMSSGGYGHGQVPGPTQYLMRYPTPSISAGPSATPGPAPRGWNQGAEGTRAEQYRQVAGTQAHYPPQMLPYPRHEVAAPYQEYAYVKYQPTPRSSSIGPWLRNAHSSSGDRARSSSVWSSAAGTPGPFRQPDRISSPAYMRVPATHFPTLLVPSSHAFPPQEISSHSRAYSPLPGTRAHLPPSQAQLSTPAPSQPAEARGVRSAPVLFRGPSNLALNYIRQATESATAAGSPIVKARRRAVPLPVESESPAAASPKPEPAATPAPGLLFDPTEPQDDEAEMDAVEEVIAPSAELEPTEEEQDHYIDDDDDELPEVIDFDDEEYSADITTMTPVKSRPPKLVIRSPKATKEKSPGALRKRGGSPKEKLRRGTRKRKPSRRAAELPASRATPKKSAQSIRALSEWFIFTHPTKKLPKEVAGRMRSSPFARVLGTDDFSQVKEWIRVAGHLPAEEIKRLVDASDPIPEDFLWETSLVTGAYRTASATGELPNGTIVIVTSSGAKYALLGPMNVAAASSRSSLDRKFWTELEDTGGLGEEGWEALILRAMLDRVARTSK
ncbi:hypothetical protein V8E36_005678 [Tilletia maclaganii]